MSPVPVHSSPGCLLAIAPLWGLVPSEYRPSWPSHGIIRHPSEGLARGFAHLLHCSHLSMPFTYIN